MTDSNTSADAADAVDALVAQNDPRIEKARAKALRDKLAKRNKRFAALSPEGKRVAIARDVLASLAAEKVIALTGTYIDTLGEGPGFFSLPSSEDAQVWLEDAPTCTTCALGAMMLSCVRKANNATIGMLRGRSNITARLAVHFDRRQLDLIETAFEQSIHVWMNSQDDYDRWPDQSELRVARDMFGQYLRVARDMFGQDLARDYTSDERLTIIMQNIIRNKGTFVPADPLPREPATK
jgi:plasmid maintenance system antidote protein VapI